MKTKPTLFLLALPLAANLGAQTSPDNPAPAAQVAPIKKLTPGSVLAAQIQEIASTKDLSVASRKRQIVAAVRVAVNAVATGLKDPQDALQVITAVATEAARINPAFADLIADAAAGEALKLPALVGRADLVAKLRDAVDVAVNGEQIEVGPDGVSEGEGEAAGAARPARTPVPASEFGGRADDVIVSPSS